MLKAGIQISDSEAQLIKKKLNELENEAQSQQHMFLAEIDAIRARLNRMLKELRRLVVEHIWRMLSHCSQNKHCSRWKTPSFIGRKRTTVFWRKNSI